MLIGKETIGQLAKQRPYPLCVVNCHIILFIKQTLCIQTHRLNTKHGLVRDAVTLIYQGIKLMCQYWQSHNWECLIFEVIFFLFSLNSFGVCVWFLCCCCCVIHIFFFLSFSLYNLAYLVMLSSIERTTGHIVIFHQLVTIVVCCSV